MKEPQLLQEATELPSAEARANPLRQGGFAGQRKARKESGEEHRVQPQ